MTQRDNKRCRSQEKFLVCNKNHLSKLVTRVGREMGQRWKCEVCNHGHLFLRASIREKSPGAASCLHRLWLEWLWSEVVHSGWAVRSRDVCKGSGKGGCEPEVLSVLDSHPQCYPWVGHVASLPLAWYLDESQPLKLQLSLWQEGAVQEHWL